MGQQGNTNAIRNASGLQARAVCSGYMINISSPVYSSRFSRNVLITDVLSTSIFDELKSNNPLTEKNYLRGYAQALWDAVKANSSKFPVIASLSADQMASVDEQLSCTSADHLFYSDLDKKTIRFLLLSCQ